MAGRRPWKTESEKAATRLAKNARRRKARAADPAYREKHAAYQRRFDQANRERERLRKRAWITDNPEQRRVNRQARRAAMRNAPGRHTRSQIERILRLQRGRCAYCDQADDLHLDHAIPLSRGGSNWPWNLQWLCAQHNVAKGAKTDAEYRSEIGLPAGLWISLRIWSAALLLAPEILVPQIAE